METLLGWIARVIARRSKWIILLTLALFVLMLLPLGRVRFSTDPMDLMPPQLDSLQAFRDLESHFTQGGDLVALIEDSGGDAAALESFEQLLVDELRRVPDIEQATPLLGGAINPASWRWLWEKYWRALDTDELDALVARLQPAAIRESIHRDRARLEASPSGMLAQQITWDPIGLAEVFIAHLKRMSRDAPSPDRNGFQVLNLAVRGGLNDSNRCIRLFDQVRQAEQRARLSWAAPGRDASRFRVGYTGRVAFTAEIASKMRANMMIASATSLALVVLLFWIGFRSRVPLLAIAGTLLMAVTLTISLSGTLFRGFNVITGSFAAILIGIGIDYGILIYNRYSAANGEGMTREEAIRHTVRVTVPGIVLGATTTATAFLAVGTASSPGFRQFGWIVSIGIVLCAALMTGFYFSLITRSSFRPPVADPFKNALSRLSDWVLRHRRGAFVGSIVLVLAAVAILLGGRQPGIGFSSDPRALRFRHSGAYDTLERLFAKLHRSSSPCVVLVSGGDWADVADRTERLAARLEEAQRDGRVQTFDTISVLFPSIRRQTGNAKRLSELDWTSIRTELRAALAAEGFRPGEFQAVFGWLESVEKAAAAPLDDPLAPTRAMMDNPDTSVLLRRFIHQGTDSFQTATYVYPSRPLDSVAAVDALRGQLGAGGGAVRMTGWDELIVEMQPLLRRDFVRISALVFAAVFGIVFLFYRRITLTLLTLLPLCGALLCMLAIMKLLGIQFNLANFFAVPIVIGAGVDYSIYVVNAFLERNGNCRSAVTITGKAVLLSALTSIIGFGSLVLTDHQGLATFGLLTATGIFFCLIFSLITLPVCMRRW